MNHAKQLSPSEYKTLPKAKPSKYRNKKVTIDGIAFDSQKEAKRYGELKIMERCGEIQWLALQPVYELKIDKSLICKYRADFAYRDKDGKLVVEDVKGLKTPVYRIKVKLMLAINGIKILET